MCQCSGNGKGRHADAGKIQRLHGGLAIIMNGLADVPQSERCADRVHHWSDQPMIDGLRRPVE